MGVVDCVIKPCGGSEEVGDAVLMYSELTNSFFARLGNIRRALMKGENDFVFFLSTIFIILLLTPVEVL